jgi:hypothetical protein
VEGSYREQIVESEARRAARLLIANAERLVP